MMDNRPKYIQTNKVISHYTESYDESYRLTDGFGQLERAMIEKFISRFLPKFPAVVVDVGGASGIYSFFMAGIGYEVRFAGEVDVIVRLTNITGRLKMRGRRRSHWAFR